MASQAYFARVAEDWDTLRAGYFGEAVRDAALAAAASVLTGTSTVADVGAGTGFMALGLAPRAARVYALEPSPEMLAVARRNLSGFDNVECLGMPPFAEQEQAILPLADGSVDAVFANMVLHHAPNPAAAIAEMSRVLKPGGRLVITDLNPHGDERLRTEMADLWLGFERDALRGWFESAGLREVAIDETGQQCCAAPTDSCDECAPAACADCAPIATCAECEPATTFVAAGVKMAAPTAGAVCSLAPGPEALYRAIETRVNGRSRPAAVLLGAQVSGLAVARSLGRRDVPIVALDSDPQPLALASRYVTAGGQIPNPVNDEQGFVDQLVAIGQRLSQPAVLFATGDEWASAIARHAERLGRVFLVPPAEHATVGRILHKGRLYREAQAIGVPVPAFGDLAQPRSPTLAAELAARVGFPCVVKPAEKRDFVRRFGQAALVVEEAGRLDEVLAQFAGDAVVQELIPSDDPQLRTVATYVDRRGRVRGSLVGHRLGVYPAGFGTSCLVETVDDSVLVDRATELLRHLGYRGIAEVEFILDERDRTWKLIDVNPRAWKWIGLPIHAGVDLPWLAYTDALDLPSDAVTPTAGVRWTSIHDLAALSVQSGRALVDDGEWQALLQGRANGRMVDATFDADDVLPFVRAMENAYGPRARACPC